MISSKPPKLYAAVDEKATSREQSQLIVKKPGDDFIEFENDTQLEDDIKEYL